MQSKIFLTNTDTTIGFLSQCKSALDRAKRRAPNKEYIQALPSFKALQKRIPKNFRARVRRSKKATYILSKNYSFRINKDTRHNLLLNRLTYTYTSSANQSNKDYEESYAKEQSDIIIYPLLPPQNPSTIFKINSVSIKKLR